MKALLTGALALLVFSGSSATFYVDYASGSDSNNGTSAGAPFKHSPGDPRRGGSVPSTLAAGDSVLFQGGVSYVVTNSGIELGWSGSSGSPITYASYGTGKAILTTGTASATATAYGMQALSHRQYLVVSNIAFIDIGGIRPGDPIWLVDTEGCTTNLLTAPPGGAAISAQLGLSHSIIISNTMRGIGTWTNSRPLSGTQSVSGGGVSVEGGTNLWIHGNTMSHMRTGIRFQGTGTRWFKDLQITGNAIGTFVVWLIDGSAASGSAQFVDTIIHGNILGDKFQHDQSQWTGCGDAPHTDGIFLRNSGTGAQWYNTVIDANFFYSSSTNSSGGTALIYASEGGGGDILFSNNACPNGRDSAIIQIAPGARQAGGRTVWFFHNTIHGGGSRPFRNTGTNHTFVFGGNIFSRYNDSATTSLLNFEAFNPITSDRNVFWNAGRPTGTYYPFYRLNWPSGGSWTTFDGWKALGYDARSLYSDPMFFDMTNATVLARDLRIGAASPARNLAADYASLYPQFSRWLTNDIAGNPRVAPFDAGAFEFTGEPGGGGGDPPPPSSPGTATANTVNAGAITLP